MNYPGRVYIITYYNATSHSYTAETFDDFDMALDMYEDEAPFHEQGWGFDRFFRLNLVSSPPLLQEIDASDAWEQRALDSREAAASDAGLGYRGPR